MIKLMKYLHKISLIDFSKESAGLLSYADQRALEIGITIGRRCRNNTIR